MEPFTLKRHSNHQSPKRLLNHILIVILLGCNIATAAEKEPLESAITISLDNNQQEAKSQHHLDKMSDETQAMLEKYQQLHREHNVLAVYNKQLQRLVQSQESEKRSIATQIEELNSTQQAIVPLVIDMVQWLQSLQQADLPFLQKERHQRIELLSNLLGRADISIGEKYRRVLEAYMIELEYSRTIESYSGELPSDTANRSVTFLRLGRLALYYQTLDRNEVGFWDIDSKKWVSLPNRYNTQIRNGIRIARQQAAPDLLQLPIQTPKADQP